MKISFNKIEALLPGYLSNDLSDKDRVIVDYWRKESAENEEIYNDYLKAWEAMVLLHEMEQFDSFEALRRVNTKLSKKESTTFWNFLQQIAAILLLPLLVYSGFLTFHKQTKIIGQKDEMMQTVISRQGMVAQFALDDGTKVWLNSGSELQYPKHFSGIRREVVLKGEAFFEVTKSINQPFRVNAGELKIDVMGTSFNVASFDDDTQSEVVLVTGKVALSSDNGQFKKEYGLMHPGERVIYEKMKQKISAQDVRVGKYTSWREGSLIFDDDVMEDVVKRLSRWFNVEIIINDPEIKNYIYKATFRNENLMQVLNLLKLSAPIEYRIINRSALPDGNFTKQKVYLMKRRS